ncbi:ribonuclease H-like domain-containing protein [Tanacetum coccineum]
MWLFRHKYNADGTLSRYKARLVANGSTQLAGIDVDETFSPVVKPATIRTVLSLAISRHWPVHQLDVKNAFLHGSLSETGADTAYLLLYVDDIVLTASSSDLLQQIITSLHAEFSMTDLGSLNYFLGISVTRNASGMFLSQQKYATEVCLFMHDPREPHLSALKRILRYVRGTLSYGLQLYSSTTSSLVAYSDADWAVVPLLSINPLRLLCFYSGNNLLSLVSQRQFISLDSSAEAVVSEVFANAAG